jgi:hypothetical protein
VIAQPAFTWPGYVSRYVSGKRYFKKNGHLRPIKKPPTFLARGEWDFKPKAVGNQAPNEGRAVGRRG